MNLEDKHLIAKFNGDCFDTGLEPAYYINFNIEYRLEDSKYHIFWDWLMPVIEKIEILTGNFRIVNNVAIIDGDDKDGSIKNFDEKIIGTSKIDASYKMVIKFIKYYNETNN